MSGREASLSIIPVDQVLCPGKRMHRTLPTGMSYEGFASACLSW